MARESLDANGESYLASTEVGFAGNQTALLTDVRADGRDGL